MQRLTRWGNSAGIRISAAVMESAGLKVGDYVDVRLLDSGHIRISPTKGLQSADTDAATKEAPKTKPHEPARW
jgi:antitoxin component of MazEF toxin-antitoxin module